MKLSYNGYLECFCHWLFGWMLSDMDKALSASSDVDNFASFAKQSNVTASGSLVMILFYVMIRLDGSLVMILFYAFLIFCYSSLVMILFYVF